MSPEKWRPLRLVLSVLTTVKLKKARTGFMIIGMHRTFWIISWTCLFPEFFAFHNTQGSWFIRVLCQVLLEQHEHRDLLSMLTEVNWRVATEFTTNTKANHPEFHGRRTMPWVASMLRKDVKV